MESIKVRFIAEQYPVERHGACWDLCSSEEYKYHKGDYFYINLGVNIKLPEGAWGLLALRSSSFKRYKVIQTNAIGIIENEYCGNDDVWMVPVLAMEDGVIPKGARIAQFTPMNYYPDTYIEVVTDMDEVSRGGFGSTGY